MRRVTALMLMALALAACGESTPPKRSAGESKPLRVACTTPQQAGQKAQDVTAKLIEAKKNGQITEEQYKAFNATMGEGFSAWSERQDLAAYCRVLNEVVADAGLK
jgi:hypothetical protein